MESNLKVSENSNIQEGLKEKWNKFESEDINDIQKDMSKLPEKLAKIYGYSKERSEKEGNEFKEHIKNVKTKKQPTPPVSTEKENSNKNIQKAC